MSTYGVEADFIDMTDNSLLEKTLKPNTKVRMSNMVGGVCMKSILRSDELANPELPILQAVVHGSTHIDPTYFSV